MEEKSLVYSCDNWLTLSQIRNNEYVLEDYDLIRTKTFVEKYQIKSMVEEEKTYHYKFLPINASPYIVYYMWDISLLNNDILSVVWPRKIWNFAEIIIEKLFDKVKKYDLTVISGMADWVDWLAHQQSIKNNIPTIAVLWWWLKYYLESSHRHKMELLLNSWWLILSEFKLSFIPTKYSFPQRNRLISWLSDVLFLPQASVKSGSLITVNFALKQKKEVYTVPNTIFDETSLGTNKLLLNKKINLTLDFDDFLSKFFKKKNSVNAACENSTYLNLSDIQKSIIKHLWSEANTSLSQISSSLWIPFDLLLQEITQLEIVGLIFENAVGYYSLK